jgi:hypothetical protein
VVVGKELPVLGDGGVLLGHLLREHNRLAVFGLRRRRLARLRQYLGKVVVTARQVAAEGGDGGVVVGQLLRN